MMAEEDARHKEYSLALGHFINVFSFVESLMHMVLEHYAKTPRKISIAIFSGVRIAESMELVRRLLKVRRISKEKMADLERVFGQLTDITKARNDIVHYGAEGVAEGKGSVSNKFLALTSAHVRRFPISAHILNAMALDLQKISIHLLNHVGRRFKQNESTQQFLDDPWLYKHPRPRQKQGRRRRGQPPKRSPPPRPSQG